MFSIKMFSQYRTHGSAARCILYSYTAVVYIRTKSARNVNYQQTFQGFCPKNCAVSKSIGHFLEHPNRGLYSSHCIQKLVNRVLYDRYIASLEQLPEMNPQRGKGDPFGEETRGFAKARQRSQSGLGATAFLRASPVDSSRVIPATEFMQDAAFWGWRSSWRRGAPAAVRRTTRRARLCHRSGAQVNQHQPLVHSLSRSVKRTAIHHHVESGAPFKRNKDLRMDIIIEKGGLRDATASEYRNKSILLDVT